MYEGSGGAKNWTAPRYRSHTLVPIWKHSSQRPHAATRIFTALRLTFLLSADQLFGLARLSIGCYRWSCWSAFPVLGKTSLSQPSSAFMLMQVNGPRCRGE